MFGDFLSEVREHHSGLNLCSPASPHRPKTGVEDRRTGGPTLSWWDGQLSQHRSDARVVWTGAPG